MFNNVVDKPGTSVGLAMYWPNSNRIFIIEVDLHTVCSRLLQDLQSKMQKMTLNMAFEFKSPKRKDSQSRPFHIVGTSFMLSCINDDDGPCCLIHKK